MEDSPAVQTAEDGFKVATDVDYQAYCPFCEQVTVHEDKGEKHRCLKCGTSYN